MGDLVPDTWNSQLWEKGLGLVRILTQTGVYTESSVQTVVGRLGDFQPGIIEDQRRDSRCRGWVPISNLKTMTIGSMVQFRTGDIATQRHSIQSYLQIDQLHGQGAEVHYFKLLTASGAIPEHRAHQS
jgi:hypothetical protein